jgi:hypothetical protein
LCGEAASCCAGCSRRFIPALGGDRDVSRSASLSRLIDGYIACLFSYCPILSAAITYEGWIQTSHHMRSHGGMEVRTRLGLQISIWKHYNFDFEWSHLPGYLFRKFRAAANLQKLGIANAFDMESSFDMRR